MWVLAYHGGTEICVCEPSPTGSGCKDISTTSVNERRIPASELMRDIVERILSVRAGSTDVVLWNEVLCKAKNIPVRYTLGWLNYQQEYMRSVIESCDSQDFILLYDRQPVALWSMCVVDQKAAPCLGTSEGPVRAPLFVQGTTKNIQKKIIDQCLTALELICHELGIGAWSGVESPRDCGLDEWHYSVMERGAECRVGHELYIDLSWDIERIKGNFRKSYRPLVGKGRKLWKSSVFHGEVPGEVFTEFRELHRQVAGRVTRPIETWNLQEQAIRQREAFLICLRDSNGAMVGASLFHVSKDEGVYAVGAYDRNLFDQPLGHVVQMEAIEHMKKLGLRWYLLGNRPYPGDEKSPTEKELNIGHFKEGFATNLFLQIRTSCPTHVNLG